MEAYPASRNTGMKDKKGTARPRQEPDAPERRILGLRASKPPGPLRKADPPGVGPIGAMCVIV
jgi:hypothetical protein